MAKKNNTTNTSPVIEPDENNVQTSVQEQITTPADNNAQLTTTTPTEQTQQQEPQQVVTPSAPQVTPQVSTTTPTATTEVPVTTVPQQTQQQVQAPAQTATTQQAEPVTYNTFSEAFNANGGNPSLQYRKSNSGDLYDDNGVRVTREDGSFILPNGKIYKDGKVYDSYDRYASITNDKMRRSTMRGDAAIQSVLTYINDRGGIGNWNDIGLLMEGDLFAYQRSRGLPATGILNAATREQIQKEITAAKNNAENYTNELRKNREAQNETFKPITQTADNGQVTEVYGRDDFNELKKAVTDFVRSWGRDPETTSPQSIERLQTLLNNYRAAVGDEPILVDSKYGDETLNAVVDLLFDSENGVAQELENAGVTFDGTKPVFRENTAGDLISDIYNPENAIDFELERRRINRAKNISNFSNAFSSILDLIKASGGAPVADRTEALRMSDKDFEDRYQNALKTYQARQEARNQQLIEAKREAERAAREEQMRLSLAALEEDARRRQRQFESDENQKLRDFKAEESAKDREAAAQLKASERAFEAEEGEKDRQVKRDIYGIGGSGSKNNISATEVKLVKDFTANQLRSLPGLKEIIEKKEILSPLTTDQIWSIAAEYGYDVDEYYFKYLGDYARQKRDLLYGNQNYSTTQPSSETSATQPSAAPTTNQTSQQGLIGKSVKDEFSKK